MSIFNKIFPKEKFPFILLGISILLASLNVRYFYIGMILFYIFIQKWHLKPYRGVSILLLELSMIFYLVVSLSSNTGTMLNGIMFVVMSYITYSAGSTLSKHFHGERSYFFLLSFFVIIIALPHLYVTILDILQNGIINPERTLSILDSDKQRAVTQRTVELSLALGSSAFFFYKTDDTVIKVYKILLQVVSVLALLCTLHYISRTGLVIFGASLVLGFLLQGHLSFRSVFVIGLVLVVFYMVSNTELFEIFGKREIEGSSMSDAGGRTERWAWAIEYILKNPFGGTKGLYNYAHNFWLDFGKDGGLFAFTFLSLFSIIYLLKIIRAFFVKLVPNSTLYLSIVVALSFMLALFTEAVHEGCPVFMYCFFIVCGATNSIIQLYHK